MKKKFITIPDAPNYEINIQGEVRNKTTGKFLKIVNNIVNLKLSDGRNTQRRVPRVLSALFNLPYKEDEWQPVPSLDYKYEVTISGLLRKTKTKHLMTPDKKGLYRVFVNGKIKHIAVSNLLWEVHGILPPPNLSHPIPVKIERGNIRQYFPTFAAAAKFLAPKVFFTEGTLVSYHFRKRQTEIGGWKITYHPPEDLSQVESNYTNIIRKKNR